MVSTTDGKKHSIGVGGRGADVESVEEGDSNWDVSGGMRFIDSCVTAIL